jgi:peptidyl-prolyl cis-trans isomerase SurA
LLSRFGVHLIEVTERRQNTLSPREQRELARTSLREKKAEDAFAFWAQDVRGRAYVEMREPPAFSR